MRSSAIRMKTPLTSIGLFGLAAMVEAAGQFLYKSGTVLKSNSVWSYFNPRLFGGVICYVTVMVLFVAGFKKGGELTVLYPIYASTFIWAAIISLIAYGTPIKPIHIVGMGMF